MAELSPMMQQYLEIKNQHKDEILFYRIGDFYEMFFDDAVTASRELDLTLTGKQCGLAERAPMCGVPFHSYEGYVARLIAKGYKVAICEQVEDPAKAKGLVKRDIIRVVTPGTVIESSMLQDDRNNYIASLYLKGKKAGLCFADVSTGTAHITELTADKIAPAVITELCRYHPSEVLLNPGLLDCREVTAYIKKNMNCSVELVEDERYAPGLVAERAAWGERTPMPAGRPTCSCQSAPHRSGRQNRSVFRRRFYGGPASRAWWRALRWRAGPRPRTKNRGCRPRGPPRAADRPAC